LVGVVPDFGQNALVWLLPDGTTWLIQARAYANGGQINEEPTLADLDHDGFLDVIATLGSSVVAFTQAGAVVNGFPIQIPGASDEVRTPQPLVAELTPDDSAVLVAANGLLYAFVPGFGGASVPGFPLPVGRNVVATPMLSDGVLYGFSTDGLLRAWGLENLEAIHWGQQHANARQTGAVSIEASDGPSFSNLLDETETYNWPNPIRDGRTFLRFRTAEDATVAVTIVDLSGALVEEMEPIAVRGGVPTEVEWTTEASSGVYFARVTATTGGREESQLIRMAIIR
ncbi:MAG: T9SS type A sorting domain-containing protein, partial [Rubricoccaceae bacterium]|nr:T9SS type A sorting domain-containing protein [Rubricoccaceae bacterium]